MNLKKIIKNFIYQVVAKRWEIGYTRSHKKELVVFCKSAGIKLTKTQGEDLFEEKWKCLRPVNKDFYRFYSHFCGNDPNIVSDDIFHLVITPLLNKPTGWSVYADKNMFEKIVNPDILPVCLFRRYEGDYMDRSYKILNMNEELLDRIVSKNSSLINKGRFIVKPTTDSGGGNDVRLFTYNGSTWVSNDGIEFTVSNLDKYYGNNFIVQECVEPSDFLKQFNPDSYSTLRLITYRSVKDDIVHFLGGLLRVGAKGSFRDNISAGGFCCPINRDGTLANFASNKKRLRYDNINGVSLKDNAFKIPNFDNIIKQLQEVSIFNTPNRLISYDIILDSANVPKIIEFNIKCQTITTIQTFGNAFFGEFTDEIIEYCKNNKDKICYSSVFRKY